MNFYEKSVNDFSEFTYQQKREKVMAMLEVLKEEGNIFGDIWQLLDIIGDVSEEVLEVIHKIIVKAMYNLHEEELEKGMEHLENMKKNLESLREKENIEKEQEEADSLLENI